jgi:hypothetical protein
LVGFGSAGDGTQGLTPAKHKFYHCDILPAHPGFYIKEQNCRIGGLHSFHLVMPEIRN